MSSFLVIALCMSSDAFAAALGKGAALHRPGLGEALRAGLIFGTIETAAPLIGWALGLAAGGRLAAVDHWIAFVLLGAIGLKMIAASGAPAPGAVRPRRHGLGVLALTAAGTSVDALAVGATLAVLGNPILATALAIGLATFAMTALGIVVGRAAGARLGRAAEAAGGLVLIGVGTSILVEHLGLWPQA